MIVDGKIHRIVLQVAVICTLMCVMECRMHLEWTMHQVMQSGLQLLQILRLVGLPWFK